MSLITTEIIPEMNKIYKTCFTFSIPNFKRKLNITSCLDINIPGLTTCHLEVHPNQRNFTSSLKSTKLVFRMDPPTLRVNKQRTVKLEVKSLIDLTCYWIDEFPYNNGAIERTKEEFMDQLYLNSCYLQDECLILKGIVTVKEMDWQSRTSDYNIKNDDNLELTKETAILVDNKEVETTKDTQASSSSSTKAERPKEAEQEKAEVSTSQEAQVDAISVSGSVSEPKIDDVLSNGSIRSTESEIHYSRGNSTASSTASSDSNNSDSEDDDRDSDQNKIIALRQKLSQALAKTSALEQKIEQYKKRDQKLINLLKAGPSSSPKKVDVPNKAAPSKKPAPAAATSGPHQCQHCERDFKNGSLLKHHMLTHNPVRFYCSSWRVSSK